MGWTNPSPVRRTYAGSFTGINGVAPATFVVDPGIVITRTGEGVYVLTFPPPLAGFKASLFVANDTGEYHELSWVESASARTITLTHKTCAYASIASGPAAEDVVGDINFWVVVEESNTIGSGL
jgi:hypothetical protein